MSLHIVMSELTSKLDQLEDQIGMLRMLGREIRFKAEQKLYDDHTEPEGDEPCKIHIISDLE